MNWDPYSNISNALNKGAIHEGNIYENNHATPDVYGKPIQFFINLQESAGRLDFGTEAVRTWRGLVTLLALRGFLQLPLYWTRVSMADEILYNPNLFYSALSNPPHNMDQLLFPDSPDWQWDGRTFYVLQWVPEKQNPVDLLLYSPITLVYPVADWRRKLERIARENSIIARFFDCNPNSKTRDSFVPVVDVLENSEPQMVLFWLNELLRSFNRQGSKSYNQRDGAQHPGVNTAQSIIQGHITRMRNDLQDSGHYLQDNHSFYLHSFPSAPVNVALEGQIPPPLSSYVSLTLEENPPSVTPTEFFAPQICYFRTTGSNPFVKCRFPDCYRIRGTKDGEVWFAFLPIHPDRRRDCISSGMAGAVQMTLRGNEGSQSVYVTASYNGTELGASYRVVNAPTTERWTAVPFYTHTPSIPGKPWESEPLTLDTWPIIAVWPSPIGQAWREYYIMLDDISTTTSLEVENLRDLQNPVSEQDAREDQVRDTAFRKSNGFVARTNYVPDAIPLVRRSVQGNSGPVSVGMVTPRVERRLDQRRVKAEVAVDFGTSSTRVFALIDGEKDEEGRPKVQELRIMEDEPLEVMQYLDGRNMSFSKQLELAREFISPNPAAWKERPDTTLFSMYHRASGRPLREILPMLDGNIYQPSHKEDPGKIKNLVPDLKWDMKSSEQFYIAFMKQLLLHITMLLYNLWGVRLITWRYALPRSMSISDQNAVRRIWNGGRDGGDLNQYLQEICGDTVFHEIPRGPGGEESDAVLSESVAASRYFLSQPMAVNAKKGYLVVDIGGGSTDVALWQRQKNSHTLVWHQSVKVAGRKMFTCWIEESLEDLSRGVTDGEYNSLILAINSLKSSNQKTLRGALIDRLLTTHAELIQGSYQDNWKNREGWAYSLCRKITRSVTLTLFALGYQVGVFLSTGELRVPMEEGFFTIAVGGRGSKMLEWLQCRDSVLEDFFREGVRAGQGLAERQERPLEEIYPQYRQPDPPSGDDGRENGTSGEKQEKEAQPKNGGSSDAAESQNVKSANPEEPQKKTASEKAPEEDEENFPPVYVPFARDPKDLLITEIHIQRSKDPKCEVGRGLLVHDLSWEQERKPMSPEAEAALPDIPHNFYLDAAERFCHLFNQIFQGSRTGWGQLKHIEFGEREKHEMADLATNVLRFDAQRDEVFNVLMEVVYTYLNQR